MKRAHGLHGRSGVLRGLVALSAGAVCLLSTPGSVAAEQSASVIADVQCNPAGGGVLDLTLINERPVLDAVFEVDGPSGRSTYTVEVGSAAAVTYTGLADGVVTVGVTIDGVQAPVSATVACGPIGVPPSAEIQQSGEPATAFSSEALPRTGSSTGGLLIGAALVASGAVASLVARRRYP